MPDRWLTVDQRRIIDALHIEGPMTAWSLHRYLYRRLDWCPPIPPTRARLRRLRRRSLVSWTRVAGYPVWHITAAGRKALGGKRDA